MSENKTISQIQHVNIFNREKIEVTGALEVVSSTNKEVNVKLENSFMQILGDGLTISKLVPEGGVLVVNGTINGVFYTSKQTKKSILGKVFK